MNRLSSDKATPDPNTDGFKDPYAWLRSYSYEHKKMLKTFIFRVDVMYQFNVFDDSMDISIKLLIVL